MHYLSSPPKLGGVPVGGRGLSPPHRKPRPWLFAMGRRRAEVRVALNDRAERYRSCNLVTERERRGLLIQNSKFKIQNYLHGAPRTNQDFVCLLWGIAEVRVALNDRAERYRSCNLVTERDAISPTPLPRVQRWYNIYKKEGHSALVLFPFSFHRSRSYRFVSFLFRAIGYAIDVPARYLRDRVSRLAVVRLAWCCRVVLPIDTLWRCYHADRCYHVADGSLRVRDCYCSSDVLFGRRRAEQ